jgi:hypothetical protein
MPTRTLLQALGFTLLLATASGAADLPDATTRAEDAARRAESAATRSEDAARRVEAAADRLERIIARLEQTHDTKERR